MAINQLQIIGIETIYTLLIVIPSIIIYFRTSKLYTFSKYRGLKYFSGAFLFLAIGFALRYLVMLQKIIGGDLFQTIQRLDLMVSVMEYFMILPGMFLFYSLIWKKFEHNKYSKHPINPSLTMIYFLTLLLVILDFYLQSLISLYVSQIILFSAAAIISYINYKEKNQYFKQFYFIAMTLFLIISITNMIAQYTIDKIPIMRFYAYIITIITIWIFLYTTNKLIDATNNIANITNNTDNSTNKSRTINKK